MADPHPATRARGALLRTGGATAAALALLTLSACTTDASEADPESKTFDYDGDALSIETHEVATHVVAADRDDILVTRWFAKTAGFEKLVWTLDGDTLEIDAGCHGIAVCDARFDVEVPHGIDVEVDGEPIDLASR
ncbi:MULTISPECIES: hypothetical protein [Actinomycetes]|uniref:Lipoprotein n=2 Tax=Actinomycetes TaxID=1760 RepID=A0ABP6LYH6_9MICC|nr:hypothetical protein [Nesterenkonia sp. PF2B19]OSM43681.1 hypothetical protein BCY76_007100 [Nesterenkonia sp. PF2B19]